MSITNKKIFAKTAEKLGVEQCKNPEIKKIVNEIEDQLNAEVMYITVGDKEEIQKYHIPPGDIIIIPNKTVEKYESNEINANQLKQKLKSKLI